MLRRRRVKSITTAGAGLSLALLLGACGSSDAPSSTVYSGSPVKGGAFYEGLAVVSSTDPAFAKSPSDRILADQLYDGLTAWDPISLSAVPAIASRWQAAPGNRQWTFTLRDNALAADGSPVTVADAKRSLERVALRRNNSPSADLLSIVSGYSAFNSNPSLGLSGVAIVDERTLRIDLEEPFAELPKLLGNPTFGITHHKPDGSAVTTGPLAVFSRDTNSLLLNKAPGSEAYLDSVHVAFFPDLNAAFAAFEEGKLDWTPIAAEQSAAAGAKYGTHLFKPSLRSLYLSFNLGNAKFADARFRQAIVHAINRPALVAKLSDSRALNGIVVEGLPGAQSGGCGDRCPYDVQRARDLLAQAFIGAAPPSVTIDLAKAPFNEAAIKQLTDDLAAVGIKAEVKTTAVESFGSVTVSPEREIFQTSWSAAYPAPDAFLAPLFIGSSASNVTMFKSEAVDKSIQDAQQIDDQTFRLQRLQAVERDVMAQVPVIPIAAFPTNSVAKPTVRGLAPLPTANFDVSNVWLAPRP